MALEAPQENVVDYANTASSLRLTKKAFEWSLG
jgi:hypothetical protein